MPKHEHSSSPLVLVKTGMQAACKLGEVPHLKSSLRICTTASGAMPAQHRKVGVQRSHEQIPVIPEQGAEGREPRPVAGP